MFKETMKSFFKSLRFIVVPMAFIYFGALSLILLFVEGLVKAVSIFGSTLSTVVKNTSGEVSVKINDIINYFKTTNSYDANTIRSYFDDFIANLKGVSAENLELLKVSGGEAAKSFLIYLIIGVVIFVVSFLISIILTGTCIRKDSGIKVSPWKAILRFLFKTVMLALLVFGLWGISRLNNWLAIPLIVVYVLFDTFISFLFAYWIHKGKTKRGFFKTIKIGDVLIYFLTAILMYVLALAILFLFVFAIRDIIMAIVVIIPFLVLVSEFFDNHAETYVARKIGSLNQKEANA